MNINKKDKKVLITGASGGIGLSLCEKFIENGAQIICISSNEDLIKMLDSINSEKDMVLAEAERSFVAQLNDHVFHLLLFIAEKNQVMFLFLQKLFHKMVISKYLKK